MPTSTNVTNLKINELTEAQYDAAVQGGVIGANELSVITDWADSAIQVSTMPVASATTEGDVVQFIGTTDANYTHGYFYECVSDGQQPATYSWTAVQVQASSGGLPTQTGNAGKFLTTDGTDASWGNAIPNKATSSIGIGIFGDDNANNKSNNSGSISIGSVGVSATGSNAIAIGRWSRAEGSEGVAIGDSSRAQVDDAVAVGGRAWATGNGSVAIGNSATATGANSIQISTATRWYSRTNSDANTFKVGNANGNYELMSADGTIPTDRFTTTPSADGTYVPTLTISSGVATRTWGAAGGGGATSTTGTLVAANWSSNSQTITVQGVTSSNTILIAPAPSSNSDYVSAGILCVSQSTNSLTFSCQTVPTNAITVNVAILN